MTIKIIIGKSGSGKTAIVDRLNTIYGTMKAINYTTRKTRESELTNADYIFVSETEFIEKLKAEFFLEHVVTPSGFYGIPKPKSNNFFIIADPLGAMQIIKYCKVNNLDYKSIFLDVSDEIRKERMIKDGADEKRLARDESYFDTFKPIYDLILNNEGDIEDTIGIIRNIIDKNI